MSDPVLVNVTKTMQFYEKNFSVFVDGVEKDEILATEPIVSMNTLTSEFYEVGIFFLSIYYTVLY